MSTKNIVIAPCGNRSYLFRESWLKEKDKKDFDLCLLFYHDEIKDPGLYTEADYFFHLRDFKYHMLHQLLTELHPEWLLQYDYFYFLDDDIGIDTQGINDMFALSRAVKTSISQASLSKDSFCSWPMFRQKKNSFYRYVGQIEVMAPLFEKEALIKCLPSFIGNRSSWGVDSVWSRLLNYPEDKLAVFDTVVMQHTQPVGGGELYVKIGVDPHEEWTAITTAFDAKKHNYREYSRYELVGKKNNRVRYFFYRLGALLHSGRRAWNDYDVMSRVISKKNKWLGIKKKNSDTRNPAS